MSAAARPLRSPSIAPQPHPAPLRAVEPRPARRPKLARASIVLACLGAIFGAQLLLSIVVSGGAYEIAALQTQQQQLDRTAQALQEDLQVLGSTQNLANQAAALGMVQSTGAWYLRLSDGAMLISPDATPRYDCTGSCGLIANELVTGIPLLTKPSPTAPSQDAPNATGPSAATAPPATGAGTNASGTTQNPATDAIPGPVTR